MMYPVYTSDIVHLNVGGTRFSTSRQTLTWIPDSFFTALLSGRISSLRDETGAIFIDRDPKVFGVILNYLRTKDIDLSVVDIRILRHEAEYYAITPLVKRLALCEDLNQSSCGDVLFYGYLPPPTPPLQENSSSTAKTDENGGTKPGSIVRIPEPTPPPNSPSGLPTAHSNGSSLPHTHGYQRCHSRNSSLDMRVSMSSRNSDIRSHNRNGHSSNGHSRAASLDLRHTRNSSADLNKLIRNDVNLVFGVNQGSSWADPLRVQIIKAHHHWIVVAYAHFVVCYRLKDSSGWQLVFTSPYIESCIERVAINSKVSQNGAGGDASSSRMVAISYGSQIRLWGITEHGTRTNIGTFNLHVRVEYLFFIGSQLVALSPTRKIGVWHAMTQHWQIQDVVPIASFDTAGSFLLLGCNNGSIYYIDMQKFPLRMKDNDLLVTELYKDPSNDPITAISVYLTPKTNQVMDYIFGDDEDFDFPEFSKPIAPVKAPVNEPAKTAPPNKSAIPPLNEPVKSPIKQDVKAPIQAPKKVSAIEPVKESIKEPIKESVKEPPKGRTEQTPAVDIVKLNEVNNPPPKEGSRKKHKSSRVVRQINRLGHRSAPQALVALTYLAGFLNKGVKGLKNVVEDSTDFSSRTFENLGNTNNSTGVVNHTAKKTLNRVNSWTETLDLLRRSMSGSVKKNVDKGHSITITTSSDAPVKTLSSFVDKWANGGGLTGTGSASKAGGGRGGSSMLPMLPPALPEVTSVDFSNFFR